MPTPRSSWPPVARTLAADVELALRSALDGERDGFEDALARLVRVDREQLATLLGTATRELLERAHPDGLDAEDARLVMSGTQAAAGGWFPEVEEELVLRALTGALGLGEHPDAPRADPDAVLAHGLLLLAELSRRAGAVPAAVVDSAMGELIRARTVEMP